MSINEKLRLIEKDPGKAYSELKYLYGSYLELYEKLNSIMNPTEVLYVDRLSLIPFTPGYIDKASVWIDDHIQYGYSLSTLIRRGHFPYHGYVIVHKNAKEEFFKNEEKENKGEKEEEAEKEEKAYDYFRSINLPAVKRHGSFQYVTSVSRFEIYRYTGGTPFPYFPGEGGEITEPVPGKEDTAGSEEETDEKKENGIMQFLKEQYDKFFQFWHLLYEKEEGENG